MKAKVKVVTNFKPQAKVLASNESMNRSINGVKDNNDCHFALEFDCGKKRCLHHIPVDDLLYVGIVVFIIIIFILDRIQGKCDSGCDPAHATCLLCRLRWKLNIE